jgi:MFS family permease
MKHGCDMQIYLMTLMGTLNHAAFGGSRVAVSLYALSLGANQFEIGVIIALYALCPMLLAVHIGKLADRVSPHFPMLMGTAGIAVALLLPLIFHGLIILYITALLIGAFFSFFLSQYWV